MSGILGKKYGNNTGTNTLEAKYKSSIGNILLIVVFSVINIILLLTNADTYFLFSAFIPYFAVSLGKYLCGFYPNEYYADAENIEFFDSSVFYVTIAVAAVIILVYFICWLFAKKKKIGAVIFALIFFIIDTLAMVFISGFSVDSIFDIIFHIWVISYLIIAISTYNKIKNSEQDNGAAQEVPTESNENYTLN